MHYLIAAGIGIGVPVTVTVPVRVSSQGGPVMSEGAAVAFFLLFAAILVLACVVTYAAGWHSAVQSRDSEWRRWLDEGDVEVPPDAPLGGAPGWPEESSNGVTAERRA